ncbi:response regulator transcription factor [Streptococcus dysgalactiae]|uniref:response regulator transcription factor n=1 Tax=Streptococcus dysgalactiae TaxID=1334 RepID=UPI0001F86050|nr:response regulator transcription factor [Streptococcus dysgalactiae]EFY03593.1 DNA-binding response regulator [Streptococcus dysgalactiae subsp. dysgalactiae ATCC 27957]MCB2847464.1 response regulator transcription factor [Streptococcus dysgalactiae subsp. dysgalactiae]QQT03520.1 response regulator transcription factor [Streptococcus dysgalactiae]SUN47779.1 DNA-binding response regulator [Streptococcus dysgalactiae subsp. dysgalactiae]SUN52122.1 DNA-binding response regulator [Streptococcus
MAYKILLVDDELEITDINKRYLQQAGYQITVASDGAQALDVFRKDHYHLIISDIMMPNMDGYDFIGEVLLEKPEQPFLFITAKLSEPDKIYSLSLGADDFISKPFSPRELVLRVKNILNRIYGKTTQTNRLVIGDLVMDYSTRVVTIANQDLNLTNKAFDLLWILANHLNHVFSKTELYERVWEEEYLDDTNTLNVHIHSLRNDLAKYSTDQTPTIKTVWGLGYKLEG